MQFDESKRREFMSLLGGAAASFRGLSRQQPGLPANMV
jgi:hypothetical protein